MNNTHGNESSMMLDDYLALTLGTSHGAEWSEKLSSGGWSFDLRISSVTTSNVESARPVENSNPTQMLPAPSTAASDDVFVKSLNAAPEVSRDPEQGLIDLRAYIGDCKRCTLCQSRTNIVFGEGNPRAKLMFVGEGPGENEDLQGRPFVGKAGELLDRMIQAMGFSRQDIYIANVVKCRPPQNRTPEPAEIAGCKPFLLNQIEVIKPQFVVVLGSTALRALLGEHQRITKSRGRWDWLWSERPQDLRENIAVMPTYHPAFLLRNPAAKKDVWMDLQSVMKRMKEMET